MALFKRNWEKESGKSTIFRLSFKIFYVHIMSIVIYIFLYLVFYAIDSILKTELTSKAWYMPVANIVCLAFYLLDGYVESWRTGARDLNLVNFQHIKYNPAKPIIAGFCSQILGLIGAILACLNAGAASDIAQRFVSFFYVNFIYPISLTNKGEASKIFYFLPILIAPIVCTIAYHLGYREIRVLDKIMYKKKKEEKETGPKNYNKYRP